MKYTCLDVSEKYVILGTNNATLYLFDKRKYDLIRLISNIQLRGDIKGVKFCTNDEDVIAVVTNAIFIMKLNLKEKHSKERLIIKITEHKQADIKAIVWARLPNQHQLFSSDSQGFIYQTDLEQVII